MIAYLSRTGNVRYVIDKLGLPSSEIHEGLVMSRPYILFTYTDGLGEVPRKAVNFLRVKENAVNLKGVIATGNVNFGQHFCGAADVISNVFNVPVIRKIDLRGSTEDVETIKESYKNILEG